MKPKTILAWFIILAFCKMQPVIAQDVFWEKMDGPYGVPSYVECSAVDSANTFYVSTFDKGIFRLSSNSEQWEYVGLGSELDRVSALAISPQGTIFAGAGRSGILRSADNGRTWKQVLNQRVSRAIAISPQGSVFASTNDGATRIGIIRSIDGGENWEQVLSRISSAYFYPVITDSHGNIFVGAAGGIFRSIDNGETWSFLQGAFESQIMYALAVDPHQRIYAGSLSTGRVFRSDDNGENWNEITHNLPQFQIWSMATSPSGEVFVGGPRGNLYKSADAGETWVSTSTGWPSTAGGITDLAAAPNGVMIAVAERGGILRSLSGGTNWAELNKGLNQLGVAALAADSAGNILLGTYDGYGLFKSSNDGMTWSNIGLKGSDISSLSVNHNGDLFAVVPHYFGDAGYSTLERSMDGGQSWTSVLTSATWPFGSIYKPAFGCGEIFVGTSDRGLYASDDSGKTWALFGLSDLYVAKMAINTECHLFAGTNKGILRSTDHGVRWTLVNGGLTDSTVTSLVIGRRDQIFVSTDHGIFRTLDNGDRWIPTELPFNGNIAVDPNGDILVGTFSNGTYRSTDDGITWSNISDGLPATGARAFTFSRKGYIFAGTPNGIFQSVPVTTLVEDGASDPSGIFWLGQNRPNPFNPRTTISFVLEETQEVKLVIHDMLGRQLAILKNEVLDAGTHHLTFDASHLGSGVLFYTLIAGTTRETKKMLLMK